MIDLHNEDSADHNNSSNHSIINLVLLVKNNSTLVNLQIMSGTTIVSCNNYASILAIMPRLKDGDVL